MKTPSRPTLRKYRLTKSQHAKLYAEQSGLCAICFEDFEMTVANIDHCHQTDSVRGLLCRRCNITLGYFRDQIDLFENAIKYLQDPPAIKIGIKHPNVKWREFFAEYNERKRAESKQRRDNPTWVIPTPLNTTELPKAKRVYKKKKYNIPKERIYLMESQRLRYAKKAR